MKERAGTAAHAPEAVSMDSIDTEARAFLKEFEDQPDEVRRLFVYTICQTMEQSGLLRLMGAFRSTDLGVSLIYRNPDTGDLFEILKPEMTSEEEEALREHIGELLQEQARSAA